MVEVADGVHRLTGGIVNFYLIEEKGKLTAIDAGTPRDWRLLITTMGAIGRGLSDLDAVILTHAHGDHIGFAERARREAEARVFVHSSDVKTAKTGKLGGRTDGKITSYLFKGATYRTVFSLARRGALRIVPVAEVSGCRDGEVLDVPGRPRVVHAPGHTPGSAALFLEEKRILFTGDTFVTWNALTGRVGPQIMPSGFNRDTPQALRSLDALNKVNADTVLPGHGEPWTDGVREGVRLAKAAGPS